jgi:UDP-N-acetylglucosamine acyltransferase
MGINAIGLRRRGFTSEMLTDIKDTYHIIYQSGLNISDAVRHLEETNEGEPMTPERRAIIDFIKTSGRGIVRGYSTLNHDE